MGTLLKQVIGKSHTNLRAVAQNTTILTKIKLTFFPLLGFLVRTSPVQVQISSFEKHQLLSNYIVFHLVITHFWPMFPFYNSRKHTKTYWAHFVISIFITYIPLNFCSKSEKSDDTPSGLYRKAGFFFIIFQEMKRILFSLICPLTFHYFPGQMYIKLLESSTQNVLIILRKPKTYVYVPWGKKYQFFRKKKFLRTH